MRLLRRTKKPQARVFRWHILLADNRHEYTGAPIENNMVLIGSYPADNLSGAMFYLEGELNRLYGLDWFYNEYTGGYHTFTTHALIGQIKKVYPNG